MIARSGKTAIPLPGRRGTLHQHEDGLIQVDDQAADGHKIEKPFSFGMRSILNAEEKCADGYLAEPDGVQYHDLTDPGPFHRRHKLGQGELMHMVGESGTGRQGLEDLSQHRTYLTPSGHQRRFEAERGAQKRAVPYQGYHRPEEIPAEVFGNDCITVRSTTHQC